MVTIVETVPAGWTPSNPTLGGTVNGRDVSWTLPAADGAVLRYDVAPGGDLVDAAFSGAMTEPGNLARYGVRGEREVLYAPLPFQRGPGTPEISDDFDDDDTLCPDGWTCNLGAGVFTPVGNADGRLQLACATDNASCGSGATSVIWNEPIDLTAQSFTAEFDAYFSELPGGNPPADALTMIIADADEPAYVTPTFVGGAGGGNGYAGLTRTLAIEFDLWQNDATEPSGYNNAAADYIHIGLTRDGAVTPHVQTHLDVLGPDARPARLGGIAWPEMVDFTGGSGFPIHLEVDYNNGNLQVFMEAPETIAGDASIEPAFPRTKVLDAIVTFAPPGGGGGAGVGDEPVLQNAWIGFTAGTGGAIFRGDVDNFVLTTYPASTPEICNNGTDDDGDTRIDCADSDCATFPACLAAQFHRADSNNDGKHNISDPVNTLNVLFLGTGSIACQDAADSNDDGKVNISDPVNSLNVLFLGTGAIPPPAVPELGACGPDPTEDLPADLGCAAYGHCGA
jgi:hypothetical protein